MSKECSAGDGLAWSCIRRHDANGLCQRHDRQRKAGKPFTPIKAVTEATARGVMHAAGFSPSVPYTGSDKPWPGVCLKCGQPGKPRYASVQQGRGACEYCSGNKIDSAIAVGTMLAADFQPDGPFPGAKEPWPGTCLKCGQHSETARYNSVKQGQGACQSCADWGIDYNKPAILYTVAGQPWIKCGIANTHRTKARLREHYNQGLVDVLHVIHLERGHDAKALEKLWKDHIDETIPKSDRPTKADLPDGYSEACRDHPDIRRWIESTLVPLAI